MHGAIDIEFAGRGRGSVEIDSTLVQDFNCGITFRGNSLSGNKLKVQNSTISGRSYGVALSDYVVRQKKTTKVDFGGGSLSSQGGNTFGAPGFYAFYLGHSNWTQVSVGATFSSDVHALHNIWSVPSGEELSRIYDAYDEEGLGEVLLK